MTLQLVVPTGIVQVTTAATVEDDVLRTLVDLDRDSVGATSMNMRTQYSPAIEIFWREP